MIETIFQHRSVRSYTDRPIEEALMQRILEAGIRASNTGNMQIYSVVVTTDPDLKAQLSPCHFGQPMVTQAGRVDLLRGCASFFPVVQTAGGYSAVR